MILHNVIYIALLILQFKSYCLGLCRTTNDHKNHTCNGHRLNQIVLSLSTRLALIREKIYDCQETDIKEGILSYPKLETLTISCGTITHIQKDAFLNVNNLQELDLSDNTLTTFVENVFTPLGNLQTLNLSHNSIKELQQHTFKGLNNLKELILSYNKISDFHPKVFDQVKTMQKLSLNNNEINFVPVRLLTKMRKLQYVDLSHNDIEDFGQVFVLAYNLKYLNLSHNMIADIPLRAFQTTQLEILDLSDNKLEVVYEDGLQLKTLKELYLQNNQIRLFEVGGLNMDYLPLELLNVENNRLVFFETDFIQTAKKLEIFRIAKNPWDCECFDKMDSIRKKFIKNVEIKDDDGPLCVVGLNKDCKTDKNNLDYYYDLYLKQLSVQ